MTEATNIGQWVIAAGVIGNMLLVWWKLSGRSETRDITPQPLMVKPSPEYAKVDHAHSQYITREECRIENSRQQEELAQRFTTITRQVEGLNNHITTGLEALNKKDEERASKLHSRIDPISQLAQSTTDRVNDHFEDHRNGRFDNAG